MGRVPIENSKETAIAAGTGNSTVTNRLVSSHYDTGTDLDPNQHRLKR